MNAYFAWQICFALYFMLSFILNMENGLLCNSKTTDWQNSRPDRAELNLACAR